MPETLRNYFSCIKKIPGNNTFMLTLLHGNNLVLSKQEIDFLKEKNKQKELITIDANKTDETALIEALETSSLLFNDRLVIIENLLSAKKKLDFTKILASNSDKEIILWENKEITKTVLAKLPKNSSVKLFNHPVILFRFLESLIPGNTVTAVNLFVNVLQKEEPEMIFFMLIRQLRNLLIVKDLSPAEITEITPWQISKLTSQAKYFTMDKLLSMYQHLLTIDLAIKSGTSSFNLSRLTEQFIIKALKKEAVI